MCAHNLKLKPSCFYCLFSGHPLNVFCHSLIAVFDFVCTFFTAGIPDIAMSALVKEQIEGMTPVAISMIPSAKFAVRQHFNKTTIFTA